MSLRGRWSAVLEQLRAEKRYRTLSDPLCVDLASNDYLGYGSGARASHQAKVHNIPPDGGPGLARSGMASRLLRGHHPIWDEVETALARWHGAEAALMLTSGYAANEGLLSTVLTPEDWVASDALNHASLIDGIRLSRAHRIVVPHADVDRLAEAIRREPCAGIRFVVVESVFSMNGDVAPLNRLADVCHELDAVLVVDEAHAVVVLARGARADR